MNGVIKTATGDLLRAGYADFENDGSFDAATETMRSDVPEPAYTLKFPDPSGQHHRWDGSGWVLEIDLTKYKAAKIKEIEVKNQALIAQGFEYPAASGKMFALDLASQILILGGDHASNTMSYPVTWNTIDGLDKEVIANAGQMNQMFTQAMGTIQAHEASGSVLKDQVRAATTPAEVDAVVDNR